MATATKAKTDLCYVDAPAPDTTMSKQDKLIKRIFDEKAVRGTMARFGK